MTANKLRVALVVTRAFDENATFGRERTLQQIRLAFESEYDLTIIHLHHVLETRRVLDVLGAGTQWLRSVGRGQPLPLQSVLYSGSQELERVMQTLRQGNFAAICVDSVRSQVLLSKLRREFPNTRIVVDFDDLISRRMQQFASQKVVPSLGFVSQLIPAPLRWSIQGPLAQLVVRYEAATLQRAEKDIADAVDAVVLVSTAERDLLREQLSQTKRARIHAVPPPAAGQPKPPHTSGPYRFVFIGSDRLVQNRLSIDCLLDMWRTLAPASELHIYGRQDRPDQAVPNVRWHGFVQDVAEAYTMGSILLLPVIMPGGIKTKVIEAWSYGCPVLGNHLAFEGLSIPDYPLLRPETEWADYLRNPVAHADLWAAGARAGHAVLSGTLSRAHYQQVWRSLMAPAADRALAD